MSQKKEELPPEARQYLTEQRMEKHGQRLEKLEDLIHNKDTGLIVRTETVEGEVERWKSRENWWKGVLNKVVVSVLVTTVLAACGRIGAFVWGIF